MSFRGPLALILVLGMLPVACATGSAGPNGSSQPDPGPTVMEAPTLIILYVADQARARAFYATVLEVEPTLDVPGMTEFPLPGGARLGLMPEAGIKTLLGEALPDPAGAAGVPRAELYLRVEDPAALHARALSAGARELSGLEARPWGDEVAYSLDPDAHVLALARALATTR